MKPTDAQVAALSPPARALLAALGAHGGRLPRNHRIVAADKPRDLCFLGLARIEYDARNNAFAVLTDSGRAELAKGKR